MDLSAADRDLQSRPETITTTLANDSAAGLTDKGYCCDEFSFQNIDSSVNLKINGRFMTKISVQKYFHFAKYKGSDGGI